jgi:hypothetical protein
LLLEEMLFMSAKARLKRLGVDPSQGIFADLTNADLRRIESALRLRMESAEENARDYPSERSERADARRWREVHRKVAFVLEWKEGVEE